MLLIECVFFPPFSKAPGWKITFSAPQERCDSSEGFSGLGCSRQNSSWDWKHVAHIWIYLQCQAGHLRDSQARGSRANPSENVPVVHLGRAVVRWSPSSHATSVHLALYPLCQRDSESVERSISSLPSCQKQKQGWSWSNQGELHQTEPAQRLSALRVNERPVRVTVACLLL